MRRRYRLSAQGQPADVLGDVLGERGEREERLRVAARGVRERHRPGLHPRPVAAAASAGRAAARGAARPGAGCRAGSGGRAAAGRPSSGCSLPLQVTLPPSLTTTSTLALRSSPVRLTSNRSGGGVPQPASAAASAAASSDPPHTTTSSAPGHLAQEARRRHHAVQPRLDRLAVGARGLDRRRAGPDPHAVERERGVAQLGQRAREHRAAGVGHVRRRAGLAARAPRARRRAARRARRRWPARTPGGRRRPRRRAATARC